jgi:hypothetical protein
VLASATASEGVTPDPGGVKSDDLSRSLAQLRLSRREVGFVVQRQAIAPKAVARLNENERGMAPFWLGIGPTVGAHGAVISHQ